MSAVEPYLKRLREIRNELDRIIAGLEAQEAAPTGTPAPASEAARNAAGSAPAPTAQYGVLAGIAALRALVDGGAPIAKERLASLEKMGTMGAAAGADDAGGPMTRMAVTEVVGCFDAILADYCTDGFADLRRNVEQALMPALNSFLIDGVEVTPRLPVIGSMYGRDAHGGTARRLLSRFADGTILAVARHAIGLPGPASPAYIVSAKTDNPVELLLHQCYEVLVGSAYRGLGSKKLATDIAKVRSWLLGLADDASRAESSLIYLRQALNMLSDLDPRPKIIAGTIQSILDVLKDKQISPIQVRIGQAFDGTIDSAKYERRYVESDKPRDTIVRIIQYGLVDASGIPIQKAVLGVSRG
ncbi:MAG: hypothetical protein ABIF71_05740 [Planctomycetota bacterium]